MRAFKGHAHWLLSAAFSRSGDLAATGDRNGEVKVWSLAGSGESLLLGEHGATVLSACFSPDAKGMVTASWGDATVKIWNVDQRKETLNFTGHQNPVQRALFSSDGQKVLSASQDGEVFLWRADTGKIIHEFKCEAMRGDYGGLAFSHGGARLAVAPCADQSVLPIRVWNANDGALLATTPPTSGSCGLTFSPDGRYFATANWDWVARLWDAQTGEQLRMFKGHSNWVRSVAFSPDSRRLLTGSEDRTIRLWDVATGQELFSLSGHKDHVLSAQFSPTGNRILSASRDSTAILWDTIYRRPLLTLKGHSGPLYSAVYSPDGQLIATAGGDGTVRLWEAANPAGGD
ncbi:MAG: WD40 repeat domain-containing protein [Verrucomicrobia bacterium]|nr:WD40 repeat domain-containing protein [Verrucomicrobiota bacterium]